VIKKLRFIEAGNISPYKPALANYFTYNKTIRNPSTGLITLTTIAKRLVGDTLMYSESISLVNWKDVYSADIVFLSVNTFNAVRSYKIAGMIRKNSPTLIVMGGLHASLNWPEAVEHADYVLTGDGDESIVDFIKAVDGGLPVTFPGVIYKREGKIIDTGKRPWPEDTDTIPDRNLLYGYAKAARRYETLWPQVHASRGCPHNCAYCGIILHFGRKIRKRSPESVVEDIRQAIAFHKPKHHPRLNTGLWITDDNFPEDRDWARAVLQAIIDSGIKTHFTVQARYEAGFDDEILDLMKRAGFFELSLGIEFLDDDTFKQYGKKCVRDEIVRSIANIKAHGIGVRGLFIVGADNDRPGIGGRIARFVIENDIHGVLIQSMFFTPGTAFFTEYEPWLIHRNWDKYDGNVVHYPKNIKPHQVQQEIINASRTIYSLKRLIHAVRHYPRFNKMVFFGEYLWHANRRRELGKELPYLKSLEGEWQRLRGKNTRRDQKMIVHITTPAEWDKAQREGAYTAPSLATEGFIHCSKTEQVVETGNLFFKGQQGLILLRIDEDKLQPECRWEDPAGNHGTADDRQQELFPHIYGPVNLDAVTGVFGFEPDAGGLFSLPAGLQ
jgi:uncharacterized protein (DUF952 family)